MKKYLQILASSLLAGIFIALGATAYLVCCSLEHKIAGSFIFGTGLFIIINFKLWLFTGKVGYALDKDKNYCLKLIVCLIGNLLGTVFFTLLIKSSNTLSSSVLEISKNMCIKKQDLTWYQMFLSSVGCGVLIYIAVEGNKKFTNITNPLDKTIVIFLAVAIFILCGFDHVIANACYYTYADCFNLKVVLWFLLMTLGNSIGAILINFMLKKANEN